VPKRSAVPKYDDKGKRLSGAAQRRQKREEIAHTEAAGSLSDGGARSSIALPPSETSELITWTASVMGHVFHQAYQDATLRGPDRYRILANLGGTIGMLRDKAREQGRIKKLAQAHGLEEKETPTGMEPIAGTVRPPTARRVRAAGDK